MPSPPRHVQFDGLRPSSPAGPAHDGGDDGDDDDEMKVVVVVVMMMI